MVQVYAEPLCRRHFAGVVSLATLFRLACFAAAVAISLLSAHAAGGLWAKVGLDAVAPTVHLTGDALVILEVLGCILLGNVCALLGARSNTRKKKQQN